MQTRDDLNTPAIAVVGVVGAVVVFAIVVALQAWFYNVKNDELQRKVIAVPDAGVAGLTAAQQADLSSYRVLDEQKGIVRIPVERAMQIVVRERNASATRPGQRTP